MLLLLTLLHTYAVCTCQVVVCCSTQRYIVPHLLSPCAYHGLRYAAKTNYRTENYQLARHVLENGLAALQVNLDEIQVELFASQQQHIMQLYCSKQPNNAFRFRWIPNR